MDTGENDAQYTITYLNAQLQSLFDISSERAVRRGNSMKPEPSNQGPFALAECYFGKHRPEGQASVEDMMFYARFDAPQIDFICNHEALFELKVEEGHFNLDYTEAFKDTVANRSRNQRISHATFSFRVPFEMPGILDTESVIGAGGHSVNVIALDFANAKLEEVTSDVDPGSPVIEYYLFNYLQLLRSAGNHILFSLPYFGDGSVRPPVDFSQRSHILFNHEEVHGVPIENVNSYLSASWSKAAVAAASRHVHPDSYAFISLAECRSPWISRGSTIHFHLRFGAPRIVALCNVEVLVYFDMEDVSCYRSDQFDNATPFKSFSNWTVAMLMNIIHETEDEGPSTRCRLDFASRRFMRQFSNFRDCDFDNDVEAGRCRDRLVNFISNEYLSALEHAHYHIVYRNDAQGPTGNARYDRIGQHIDVADEIDWDAPAGSDGDSGVDVWDNIAQNSDMCGVDQVTALSHFSINSQLYSAWKEQDSSTARDRPLVLWAHQESFRATFKPMTVHLRRNGRAIVFLHIIDGSTKLLKSYAPNNLGEKYPISDLRVAFDVGIEMCDHANLGSTAEWRTRFAQSTAYKEHGSNSNVGFKHLCLDLQSAECLPEACRFGSLFAENTSHSVEKVQAIVVHLRDYYLKRLVQLGHHVLCTIPVWSNAHAAPPLGLTSVAFNVYSKAFTGDVDDHDSAMDQSSPSEPIITILGMCGGRPLPTTALHYSADWIAHSGKRWSHGTVGVSSDVFLRERLLPLLSEVNAATAIVPDSLGSDGNKLKVELTSLSKRRPDSIAECSFPSIASKFEAGCVQYQWAHHDDRTVNHRAGSYKIGGVYSVFGTAMNTLTIPTKFANGAMEIKLEGRVVIELNGRSGNFRNKASATWTTSLFVRVENGKFIVNVVNTPTQYQEEHTLGDLSLLTIKPIEILRRVLPQTVDLSSTAKEFELFDGVWRSCYPPTASLYSITRPFFNHRGDLLFELRPFVPPPPARDNAPTTPPINNIRSARTPPINVPQGGQQTWSSTARQTRSSSLNAGPRSRGAAPVNVQSPLSNGIRFADQLPEAHGSFSLPPDVPDSDPPTNGTTYYCYTSDAPQQPGVNTHFEYFERTTGSAEPTQGTPPTPPTANNQQQQRQTFTTFGERGGAHGEEQTTSYHDEFPSMRPDSHFPDMPPFGAGFTSLHAPIPEMGRFMPPRVVEHIQRAAGGVTSGYTTSTTTSRSSTPQLFSTTSTTTRSSTPARERTPFENAQKTNGGIGGSDEFTTMFNRGMGFNNSEMRASVPFAAHGAFGSAGMTGNGGGMGFGGSEMSAGVPSATRSTVYHSSTGGGAMRREEHFSSGRSQRFTSQGGWTSMGGQW